MKRTRAKARLEQLCARAGGYEVFASKCPRALARFGRYQPDTLSPILGMPVHEWIGPMGQLGADWHTLPTIIITGKGQRRKRPVAADRGGGSVLGTSKQH